MKLNEKQIEDIACGMVKTANIDDRVRFDRFTAEQLDFYSIHRSSFFQSRSLCSAGIKLAFHTNSSHLKLKGVTAKGTSRSYYAIDVLVNGVLIGCVDNFLDIDSVHYLDRGFEFGNFEKSFELGDGVKSVEIYLPFSVVTEFEEIVLDDGSFIEPIKSKYRGLLFGDSITQGYDCAHPSKHYAVKLAKMLDVEFVNKAIGGEIFNPKLAKLKDNFLPQYIVVAYGTNDWGTNVSFEEFQENCREFYFSLRKNYPDSKIIALSPIWRKEILTEKKAFEFKQIGQTICKVVSEFSNTIFIDGFDFVPHEEDFFADSRLHPNQKGFAEYANNLCKSIQCKLQLEKQVKDFK